MSKPIPRNRAKIAKPLSNPAAGLINDTLEHYNITPAQAARDMNIPRSRLSAIKSESKGVSVDTALRLEQYLGLSAEYLMKLQSDYDFRKAYHEKQRDIKKEVKRLQNA